MLSACSTWPNVMLYTVHTVHSVWQSGVCCNRCFLHRAYRGRCWYIYFDHLTRCLASQILLLLRFFFSGNFVWMCVHVRIFKLSVFDDVGAVFWVECGSFCTCVCSFSSTAIILLRCIRFALSARTNYFILIFQFRNDNNNLPAAKPKIKFTAIQSANNGIFAMVLAAISISFAQSLCPLLCCCSMNSPHCTHMLSYIHVRLFALLFHYLFAC